MARDENEDKLLRSVALQTAQAVLLARERAERELIAAKEALELKSADLAEQRGFFRVTLASIGDAVITTDTSGVITLLNPVAKSNYSFAWGFEHRVRRRFVGLFIDDVEHLLYCRACSVRRLRVSWGGRAKWE
jgi:hypothetical protein